MSSIASGEADLVELGMSVWALSADATDADMRQVKGGTVVAIETDVDAETGELQRRFVTATAWRGAIRFDVLTADEVAQLSPMNVAVVRGLIRVAAAAVAKPKRSTISSDEARCIDLQYRLKEILG